MDEREGLPSASYLDAYFRCYGSRALCRKSGRKPPSKDANYGTRVHAALSGDLSTEQLTKGEIDTYRSIVAEEERLVKENGFEGSEKILTEQRLWVMNDAMEKQFSARVDRCYIKGHRGLCLNWKCGFHHIIPIPHNWQVKCETSCVQFHFGLDEILGGVVSPHDSDSLSQIMLFKSERIEQNTREIIEHIASMTEDSPRTPNGISCEYCQAKEICSEYQALKSSIITKDGEYLKPDYQRMSPEEKGERCRAIKIVKKGIEIEEDYFKLCLSADPSSVLGWKLVPSSMRVIVNRPAAIERLTVNLGKERTEACLDVSISAVEAFLQQSGIPKSELPEKVIQIFGDAMIFKPKQPSLKEKKS